LGGTSCHTLQWTSRRLGMQSSHTRDLWCIVFWSGLRIGLMLRSEWLRASLQWTSRRLGRHSSHTRDLWCIVPWTDLRSGLSLPSESPLASLPSAGAPKMDRKRTAVLRIVPRLVRMHFGPYSKCTTELWCIAFCWFPRCKGVPASARASAVRWEAWGSALA
jgi:hypothetical protein